MISIMFMKVVFFFALIYWKIFHPLTIGVRLMLIQNDEIVLVSHTYRPGWYLPGGGLKRRESFHDAARREAHEEAGATLGELKFWGIYSSLIGDTTDHEVVLLCEDFQISGKTDREIAECRAFPLTELPPETVIGARKCVKEYLEGNHQPDIEQW